MIITKLRRLGIASVITIGASAVAWAASESIVTPIGQTFDLQKIPKALYKVDPTHANVVFMVNHLGYSAYIGRFDSVDGTLKFDPKDPTKSKLEITIDPASISVQSATLKENLLGKNFFDVATYPVMTFESTKIEKLSDKTGRVTGNLTLHGVTKPVTLDVTFNGSGTNPLTAATVLGFSVRGELNRADFGMNYATNFLGEKVAIIIETEFHHPPKTNTKPR